MSLSAALHGALSGLTSTSRASQTVASNISNALTPGYSRRSLEVASNTTSGIGVQVVGVQRHVDPALVSVRRGADAILGTSSTVAQFHRAVERLVGQAGDTSSIAQRLAQFDSDLVSAAARPDSSQRQDTAVGSASSLARSIRDAADGVQNLRLEADRAIANEVERLGTALQNIQKLNVRIASVQASGGEASALLDQRQLLVDEVNTIIPVREMQRPNGQIAVLTEGGSILLDGSVAEISFAPAGSIGPTNTIANGSLSGLEIGGRPVDTARSNGPIAGGTLAAHFKVRDELAIDAQADLDALAYDLVSRFEESSLDPTRAPGETGLFTDGGLPSDPATLTGLANRLDIDARVDPDQGGEAWRLRDGLGATSPGAVGNASLLQALAEALSTQRTSPSPSFGTGSQTAASIAAGVIDRVSAARVSAEAEVSFAAAGRTELMAEERAMGVDTDAELQTLIELEQAYAANAKMLEVVDDLMQTLLRI
jgi:flagellar hook-associated protein 1 FlgK